MIAVDNIPLPYTGLGHSTVSVLPGRFKEAVIKCCAKVSQSTSSEGKVA